MELYRCIAYDEYKKRKILNLKVESEEEAIKYIRANNLRLTSIKKKNILSFRSKLKYKELKILCNQLGILFESGCEITEALDILIGQSSKKVKLILQNVVYKIKLGNSITESFKSTNMFSKFFISMLEAGELSSSLDIIMYRLYEYYDKESKLKTKMLSISIYPMILAIVTFSAVIVVLVFIMPRYESIYVNNKIQIPLITQVLINLSHFITDNYVLIILMNIILFIVLINLLNNNKNVKKDIYVFLSKLPIIGDYILIKLTNKFAKSFYILMKSGVQIVDAIDISAKVIDKEYIYESICVANNYIKKGNSISKSLERINLFPKLFITMIMIGETTGRLDDLLESINKFYENELDEKIEIGTKYFEVGIILVMGIVVGLVVISMVVPMFNTISSF